MRVSRTFVALLLAASPALATEIEVRPISIAETKAVFGRVETRDQVPARSRIGGTVTRLDVTEGSEIKAGDTIALIIDDKLEPQLRAAEARVRALTAERTNALTELDRAQALVARGAGTVQRVDQLRTQTDVLLNQITASEAEKAVLLQQQAEGAVKAPLSGRILKVPVTKGGVVLPGEVIAQVGGGGFFLRLALPERHATALKVGDAVVIGEGGQKMGKLAKVFPLIENGRVIADIEAADVGNYFVGERVMVAVPVARREALAVTKAAVVRRAGLDLVRIRNADGSESDIVVVTGGEVTTQEGPKVEILSGLRSGDKVIVP
ncbi:MAG TPA: efflux RND transporter periplasmic adaptor subunit [Rhabdaerophilum sp.]|nr:efflux RND transporter periplasmic adaptor subunit [Rhabdaerophilum sp.]